MTHRISFRPEAEADLLALYGYIAERSGNRIASRYISAIETACLNLATFPERGASREDLGPGIRLLNVKRRVTVAYLVDRESVRIVRVFYAGRDYEAELMGDDT